MVVMVFEPMLKGIAPEAEPDATVVPLTFIVALASVDAGVTVIVDMVFGTLVA